MTVPKEQGETAINPRYDWPNIPPMSDLDEAIRYLQSVGGSSRTSDRDYTQAAANAVLNELDRLRGEVPTGFTDTPSPLLPHKQRVEGDPTERFVKRLAEAVDPHGGCYHSVSDNVNCEDNQSFVDATAGITDTRGVPHRALSLLVQASRVSPPLRAAMAEVEAYINAQVSDHAARVAAGQPHRKHTRRKPE